MSKKWEGWTLVFDLDGTLVETAPDLHAALNHTLSARKLGPVPLGEIRHMIGDGAKALIRKGFSWHQATVDEAEIDRDLWPIFIDHYLANICRLSRPFDGTVDTLARLKQDGAILAVCTNKAQHLAEAVLQGLDLWPFFSATLGGDTASLKKPDAAHLIETIRLAQGDQRRAIMVGDAETDEGAARRAELPLIFAAFGYGTLSGEPFPKMKSIDHWDDMENALTTLAKQA